MLVVLLGSMFDPVSLSYLTIMLERPLLLLTTRPCVDNREMRRGRVLIK